MALVAAVEFVEAVAAESAAVIGFEAVAAVMLAATVAVAVSD